MTHENNEIIKSDEVNVEAASASNTASVSNPTSEERNPAAEPATQVSRRRKVAWYDFLVILLIFLLSQVVGTTLIAAVGVESPSNELLLSERVNIREDAMRGLAAVMAINFFSAMFISVVLVIAYLRLRRIRVNVKFFAKGWAMPYRLLVGYVLLWCFSIVAEPLVELLPTKNIVMGSGFWLLITTVIFAPFFEELLFRGYILGAVRSRYGIIAAWLLSSALFGAVHGVPASILSAALSGLVLGYYYLRYDSLMQVMLLHAMNNLTVCFMMSIGVADKSIREIVAADTIYWTIYVLAAIISLYSLGVMIRQLRMRRKINISAKQ